MLKTLQENLVKFRKKYHHSQEEIGEITGKSKTAVASWEQGRSEPNIETLCTLSKYYGVSLDELCGTAKADYEGEVGEHYLPKTSDDREWHAAPGQIYTQEYLKELRDKYNIIYNGTGIYAFKIIPRKTTNPLLQLFSEDDGMLSSTNETFDISWTRSVIAGLQEVYDYWREKYDKVN